MMIDSPSAFERSTFAAANLPRLVRRVLERLFAMLSDEMAQQLNRMMIDFEQQLFRLADQARHPAEQARYFETLRLVRLDRADVVPRYLIGLENALSRIREPQTKQQVVVQHASPAFRELRLVDDTEVTEESVLRGIASRQEARAGLQLHLLGQRFGVLAGSPAMDAERLPVGPYVLGTILAEASRAMQIGLDDRLLLFRTFDRMVMMHFATLMEMCNALLARENVLPTLAFVPTRARPTVQNEERGAATPNYGLRGATFERDDAPMESAPIRPHTAWFGEEDSASRGGDSDGDIDVASAFALLQQLLSGKRQLLSKLRPERRTHDRPQLQTAEVVATLGRFQGDAANNPSGPPRSLSDVRQALLAQNRQLSGHPASLSREDNDAFELLELLLNEISRDLNTNTPAVGLLKRLQLPLLRVALMDRAFFVRHQHPARQLLNTVAESGATWLAEEEADPVLTDHLQRAVDHVVENYHGDTTVFEHANRGLQEHLQSMARKAEVTERRHVEAARGKEKLEVAKRRATEVIDEAMQGSNLPRFQRALLNQAWSDVLTLTLLRHGEDSNQWRQLLDATRQIVAAKHNGSPAAVGLAEKIEQALGLVGYHAEEATAIARRLSTGGDEDEDAASRTELAMKLKARGRLGEEQAPAKPTLPPRTEAEQASYEQLRALPFGTWFEFVINQQGDVVRHRLSWFSPITDHALFVNQRGLRVGEQSLDGLARLLANGQARVVTADRGRLVDRAWQAALAALRNFASHGNPIPDARA